MKNFKANGSISSEVRISSWNIAGIIEEERDRVFGADCFINDEGEMREKDYRFNGTEFVRNATEDEIELFKAFLTIESHFKSL